jgi:hypothetical protein
MSFPQRKLTLWWLPERYAVCRLSPNAPLPAPSTPAGTEALWSVTRTAEEVSVVLPESEVQAGWKAETDWRCLKVQGPIDFGLTGVLASVAAPLAEAGVSLFAVSTYDTDYILVRESQAERAGEILRAAGHSLR